MGTGSPSDKLSFIEKIALRPRRQKVGFRLSLVPGFEGSEMQSLIISRHSHDDGTP